MDVELNRLILERVLSFSIRLFFLKSISAADSRSLHSKEFWEMDIIAVDVEEHDLCSIIKTTKSLFLVFKDDSDLHFEILTI